MSDTARSLVRDPQGVRAGEGLTGTPPALAALVRSRSSGAHADAVAALANELLDPVAGLAQGARALMSFECKESNEFREELLGLMYDRARELHDALVYYDRLARPAASGIS